MQPLIIDIEASGFGKGSYPIEVGFVLADGKTHCMLIQPESDWTHWDESAEKLHKISREILLQHGNAIVDVATLLNRCLEGQVVYSDAWGNDMSWLALLFDCAGMRQGFRVESLRTLLTEAQVECWHEVKDGICAKNCFQRHRASHDAVILQQTFIQTTALGRREIG